jgi:hypothetical protein
MYGVHVVTNAGLVSCLSCVTMLFLQGEEEEKGGNSCYLEVPVASCIISTSNCSKRVVLILYSPVHLPTVIAVNAYISDSCLKTHRVS